jgi:hypothetical protein
MTLLIFDSTEVCQKIIRQVSQPINHGVLSILIAAQIYQAILVIRNMFALGMVEVSIDYSVEVAHVIIFGCSEKEFVLFPRL